MRIDIITILPKLLESPLSHSIIQRAQTKGILEINVHNLRDFSTDKHKNVDDYAFGGGAGMVMMIEPIANCIESLRKDISYDDIIYLCPDGEMLNQSICNQLSLLNNIILLCGHYKGIDERIREHLITREISIGEYVISGGELAAAVLVDSVGRLLPGVLNNETSALYDSFQDDMIAPPVYTRPATYKGLKVPDVLLSGNDKKIQEWRQSRSEERTKARKRN